MKHALVAENPRQSEHAHALADAREGFATGKRREFGGKRKRFHSRTYSLRDRILRTQITRATIRAKIAAKIQISIKLMPNCANSGTIITEPK
jgi:hypothetical protein